VTAKSELNRLIADFVLIKWNSLFSLVHVYCWEGI
jgi:hypothetical protein